MTELNLFGVILLKRVTSIDSLIYGLLTDEGKPHRVHIECKGIFVTKMRRTISLVRRIVGRNESLGEGNTITRHARGDVASDCEE